MMLKQNDLVLLVHNETPESRSERMKEPHDKRQKRPSKVSFCDRVKRVASKKTTFDRDTATETDDKGVETQASKDAKASKKSPVGFMSDVDPEVTAYVMLPEWFPTPFGYPAPGTRIDIDEVFLQNVVIPYNAKLG
jgi:hypothetical protein